MITTTYIESHNNKSGCQPVTSNKFPRRGYNVSFSTPDTVIHLIKQKQLTQEKWVNPGTTCTPNAKKDCSIKPILRNPTPYYHLLNIKFPSYKSRQTRECAFEKLYVSVISGRGCIQLYTVISFMDVTILSASGKSINTKLFNFYIQISPYVSTGWKYQIFKKQTKQSKKMAISGS